MKKVNQLIVGLGVFIVVEFIMMLIYNILIHGSIEFKTIINQVLLVTGLIGGAVFLYLLITAQVKYIKTKNDNK